MDGNQSLQFTLRSEHVLSLYQEGDNAGLPVVAVQNFGLEVQQRNCFQDCAGEVCVLFDFSIAASVQSVAVEVVFVVNQVYNNVIYNQLFDAYVLLSPTHGYGEVADVFGLAEVLLLNALVVGGDNAAVDAELCERLGQCADYVSQTTGLGQGSAFGAGNQHLGHFGTALFFQNQLMFTDHVNISFPMIMGLSLAYSKICSRRHCCFIAREKYDLFLT